MAKITVQNTEITVVKLNDDDYISLTNIARYKSDDPTAVLGNWMRNRNTIEYLGIWETLYNPNFNPLEFEGFRREAGLNAFTLSPTKWVERTNAIGIVSKAGRYGGTYAHKDIAFKFASWISVEFELYIVKEFQRRCKTYTFKTASDKPSEAVLLIPYYHYIPNILSLENKNK